MSLNRDLYRLGYHFEFYKTFGYIYRVYPALKLSTDLTESLHFISRTVGRLPSGSNLTPDLSVYKTKPLWVAKVKALRCPEDDCDYSREIDQIIQNNTVDFDRLCHTLDDLWSEWEGALTREQDFFGSLNTCHGEWFNLGSQVAEYCSECQLRDYLPPIEERRENAVHSQAFGCSDLESHRYDYLQSLVRTLSETRITKSELQEKIRGVLKLQKFPDFDAKTVDGLIQDRIRPRRTRKHESNQERNDFIYKLSVEGHDQEQIHKKLQEEQSKYGWKELKTDRGVEAVLKKYEP
jgi:hypothetical protein